MKRYTYTVFLVVMSIVGMDHDTFKRKPITMIRARYARYLQVHDQETTIVESAQRKKIIQQHQERIDGTSCDDIQHSPEDLRKVIMRKKRGFQ